MVWDAWHGGLGANPVEAITHRTGSWGLRFLLLTLAITPFRRLTGWSRILRVRRMLGLYAFFYVSIHFAIWLILDHFFDWQEIVTDIIKRPYITVGFVAFVLLVPLAITSTDAMIRRLGRRWRQLHQAVYLIAVLGVLHFLWLVKADWREPVVYGLVLIGLLTLRTPAMVARMERWRNGVFAN
ncbi:MAG: sulfoxide reductase heme-binding subunit YedZ [Gammaproteobacteria bacterium]|nr:sulfoxide reductase heme-binding subunit YedZ [Gammaproteobacteria bacterium]MCP5137201.1 sulfoxide reductase heme-binding subunit YedZ [Gammaproteobacteria bacterium]